MKVVHRQRGESQPLALFLLVIVIAIIMYLFWAGEIGTSARMVDDVMKVVD